MKLPRLCYLWIPFVLAALACNTVTNAFRTAAPPASETPQPASATLPATARAPATPTHVPITPAPTRTRTGSSVTVTASEIPDDGLKIPGGPTIASPLTTRRRAGEGLPFLEAFAAEQYTPEALSQAGQTYTFTVTLDTDQAVLWGSNWCTTTDAILRDNFAHITLEFSVNAVPIDLEQFVVADIPAQDAACRYYLAVVSGWPEGETLLDIRITFDEPLSDGFSDYPAGTHVYHYVVTRN